MIIPSGALVVLAGPSGSGKSTWAAEHFRPDQIVSSDALRELVGTGEHDVRAGTDAFAVLDLVVERRMRRGLTTVIDSLAIDPRPRARWIELGHRHERPVHAVAFDTADKECRSRNKARERPVPSKALTAQLRKWPDVRAALDAEFDEVHTPGRPRLVPPSLSAHHDLAIIQEVHPMPLRFGLTISSFTWPVDSLEIPTMRARVAREAEEAGFSSIELFPLLWGAGAPAYRGRRVEVAEAISYPRPIQERIPILVGGSGERRTLDLVARYADACNLFGEPDVVRAKIDVLHAHCRRHDRDPADVTITQLSSILCRPDPDDLAARLDARSGDQATPEQVAEQLTAGTVDDHIGRFRALADVGVEEVIVSLADVGEPGAIESFAPVIGAFG